MSIEHIGLTLTLMTFLISKFDVIKNLAEKSLITR